MRAELIYELIIMWSTLLVKNVIKLLINHRAINFTVDVRRRVKK
jgi:hypothetical protein